MVFLLGEAPSLRAAGFSRVHASKGTKTETQNPGPLESGTGISSPQGLAATFERAGMGRPEELCPQFKNRSRNPQPTMTFGTGPSVTLSYGALLLSLSRIRISAYSLETDTDSVDAVARYLWNIALVAALQPVLHVAEVAFRNALYDVGVETTAGRITTIRAVPCWLDAAPTLLERMEHEDVMDAIQRLGHGRRRHTPGHLVGELGFGFWIRLCHRPYEHGRMSGPRLWPTATKRFPNCPRTNRNRVDIGRAFGELRDFRNSLAHHQPIWDRKPVQVHTRALELIDWMSPQLCNATRAASQLQRVYNAGPGYFKSWSRDLMTV